MNYTIGRLVRRTLNEVLFRKYSRPEKDVWEPGNANPLSRDAFRFMERRFHKQTRGPRWGVVHLTFGSRPGRFVPLRVKLTKGARPRVFRRALERIRKKART